MTLCIQYAKPTSGLTGAEIFGLDVAVNNLLLAWFRHGRQEKFLIRPVDEESFAHCKSLAKRAGLDAEKKLLGIDPRYPVETLSRIHCLIQADPLLADLAWQRRQIPGAGYSLCGLIHTMSGERIARTVGELCIAPMADTDALICPSNAIRTAVQNLWATYNDYLGHRFGGKPVCPVELPVIPLGVDCGWFEGLSSPDKRAAQRAALQAGDDEIILLFLGRMSFATKAHPAPLFLAAEMAAQLAEKPIRLVMFGYFKPEMMEEKFRALGGDLCEKLNLEFIANDDPRFPDGLWAGADIFISPVDNIQESFGLTPVEAMASGLPVIVSDWDGYRDSVRPGEDGFVIPTYAPPVHTGLAIADRYFNRLDNYGEYLSAAGQGTAVEIEVMAGAIIALANNADLRARLGANGRRRAREVYDWRHIIAAYEALWNELGQRRRAAPPPSPFPDHWQAAHPAYPNPYAMFSAFPTTIMSDETKLRFSGDKAMLEKLLRHEMNYFVPDLLLKQKELAALAEKFTDPQSIGAVLGGWPVNRRDHARRSCGWLLKFGLCATLD